MNGSSRAGDWLPFSLSLSPSSPSLAWGVNSPGNESSHSPAGEGVRRSSPRRLLIRTTRVRLLTLATTRQLNVASLHSTEQLVTLVTIAPASSPAPLALYSAIHSLLFPLVSSTPPSVSLVASYFSDSLFPALRAAKDAVTDPAERVADVIIDVVWQIDQEIENGMLQYRTAASTLAEADAPSGEEMDVDGAAGSKDAAGDGAEATASAESAAEKELLRQQQNKKQEREGRQRLAELVKILIVRAFGLSGGRNAS